MNLVFRLDEDGGISAYATQAEAAKAAAAEGGSTFETFRGLTTITKLKPVQLLVDCWNSLPGVTPVKRFKDRDSAVRRIWAVIEESVAPTMREALYPEQHKEPLRQGQTITLTMAGLPVPQPEQQQAPAAAPEQHQATAAAPERQQAHAPREGSKKAQALAMLKAGTTREALQTTFGWLAHTTRGFLSILGKTHKLEVTKQQDGTRYYRLAS